MENRKAREGNPEGLDQFDVSENIRPNDHDRREVRFGGVSKGSKDLRSWLHPLSRAVAGIIIKMVASYSLAVLALMVGHGAAQRK
jgi:hypothetical protein